VDGIDVRDFGSADDSVCPQVAIAASGTADTDSFVSQLDVKRLHIRFRVDGQCLNPQFTTGSNDTEGNFTAVSDEDFLNHELAMTTKRSSKNECGRMRRPIGPMQPVLIGEC
jgi:hypothetical protein